MPRRRRPPRSSRPHCPSSSATSASPLPSRLSEEDRAEEGLRGRGRVVRVDGERDDRGVVRLTAVDLPVVVGHVAPLGEPLAEVGRARAHDDVGDGPGLLALHDRAGRRGRVPDVADDLRAYRLGEARPDEIELSRLVVRALLPAVTVHGQDDPFPRPLEDGRLLEIDLPLDVLPDGRALDLALEMEDAMAVVLLDHHVVLRQTPGLAPEPALWNTLRPKLLNLPVLDGDDVSGPSDGRE